MNYRKQVYDTYSSVSGLNRPLKSKSDSLRRNLGPLLKGVTGPLLDIGSGQGELLDLCRELNIKGEGIDVSAELASNCTERGLVVHTISDLPEHLAGCTNQYGAVAMIDVLEHFTRPEAFSLVELIRKSVLAPGGRLVIQVPNMQSPFAALNLYHDVTHEWAYTEASLRQLLLAVGFSGVVCHPQHYPWTGFHLPRHVLRMGFYACLRALLLIDQPNRGRILTPNVIAVATL